MFLVLFLAGTILSCPNSELPWPELDPVSGIHSAPLVVCNTVSYQLDQADIRYTLDRSDPAASQMAVSTEALEILLDKLVVFTVKVLARS